MTSGINRSLSLELVRVTEAAAVACAPLIGRGDEKAADQAAVNATRTELNRLNIDGRVVIGEGERDEAPMLYIGEEVGTGQGPKIDIALDPLEGTTLTAKGMPNALAVIALAEHNNLLNAPDTYMQKIAVGGWLPDGVIDLDASPQENIKELAQAKGVGPEYITVCVLDRPRHQDILEGIRSAGAKVSLISDGDVAGIIHTTDPATGIDLYIGTGGAPEGVLAAAALACTGGQMQGRLVTDSEHQKERAAQMGVSDFDKKYSVDDMAKGDIILSLTGVTSGSLVKGVSYQQSAITTDSLVMRRSLGETPTSTTRWIRARHHITDKFSQDGK
ncbi:MAG: class II fructose-bisphosphatase [Pseudomonadota bacterium]|nr:class II fructose-bisphosphatase [Pseudomonadota bacterium]